MTQTKLVLPVSFHRPVSAMACTVVCDAGRSSATLGVSQAVQDTARLHQAAKLAAAVALPPTPAASAPGMAGNVGRASVADLFTATPPVFGPTSAGKQHQRSGCWTV